MTIATGDPVVVFDEELTLLTTGTPGTIADNAFSAAADIAEVTLPALIVPKAAFVLELEFASNVADYTGSVSLHATLQGVDGASDDEGAPNHATHIPHWLGNFTMDWNQTTALHFLTLTDVNLPFVKPSQIIQFWIYNNGTGQQIDNTWDLWYSTYTIGQST